MLKRFIGLVLSAILISGSCAHSAEDSNEITFVPPGFTAPVERIVKVTNLPSGEIILDGKPASLESLRRILASARGKVLVWYHRDPNQAPTPAQVRTLDVILDNKAPVSLSAKPDFSDYVDERGRSHPRRPRSRSF